MLGVDVVSKGVQPVWVQVENPTPEVRWLLRTGTAPDYFGGGDEMKKAVKISTYILLMAFWLVSVQAVADLGVTDNCQDEVKELEEKMEENRDDYTAESRTRARAELTAAKTNRLDPIKCRKNLQDARQELRQGKRDKR